MKLTERIFLIALCLLSTTTIRINANSSAKFNLNKTNNTPLGAGMIYLERNSDDKLKDISEKDWIKAEEGKTLEIELSNNDQGDGKVNSETSAIYAFLYAKPNKGYQFNGWYDKENNKITSTSKIHYDEKGNQSTWNNGGRGEIEPIGQWGEYFYFRNVVQIKDGQNPEFNYYVDFSLIPRSFTLMSTGFDDVSYTATADSKSYTIGTTDVSTENISSNIALSITYDSNKYIFNGWKWSSGKSGKRDMLSIEANYTYILNEPTAAERENVHIWAELTEKVDHVAEVTYNEITTPYETWDEALAAAKADGVSGATIKLKMDIPDVLTMVQTIDRPMTIDLNNHSINGSVNNLFTISSPNVVITDNSVAKGGAITLTSADVRVTYAVTILSGGQLTLENGSIINKNTYTGADKGTARGLEVQAGATLKMTGGYVEAQSAQTAYAIINRGTTTISGGEAYANTTTAETAVGFYNVGSSATINGGVFRALTKTTGAYGIWQNTGNTLTINNATVSATATTNTAYALRRDAGKIIVNDGKFKVSATSTLAPVNTNNNTYITLYGGVYNKYTNLRKSAAIGYDCYELELGQDYTDGYRFCIKDKNSNPSVCKIVEQSGTTYYSSLADALAYANANSSAMTIILTAFEHTLPAGNYTLPKNATLSIPYNVEGTVSTNTPDWYDDNSAVAPSPFRTLTLAEGVAITVNGAINVNAKLRSLQNTNGAQSGASGMINMEKGSTITLNNGANLYCWGIIYGEGEITANSGATVYESFQVNDYPGGTFLSSNVNDLKNKKVFPMRIYCFPNIQTKLHLHHGATEKVATAFASFGLQKDIVFISSNAGLFIMQDGSILTKWYDTKNDLQRFELKGDANLKSVSFNVGYTLLGSPITVPINSNEFVLAMSHNMHVDLLPGKSGIGTVNITEDIAIHPGAKVYVGKNVMVNIEEGNSIYVYDIDNWKNIYTFANGVNKSVVYNRSKTISYDNNADKTKVELADGIFEIAGTIKVNGALYTTESGADIRGIDGGKIIFKAAPTTTSLSTVHQVIQDPVEYVPITTNPAWLHNGKEWYEGKEGDLKKEYLAGVTASTTIQYANNHWGWMEIWKDADGTILKINNTCTQVNKSSANTLDDPTFVGWSTEINKTNQEVIHTAHYTTHNSCGTPLDIVDADGTNLTINANGWASSGWPYTINGTEYRKDDKAGKEKYRQADRTLVIPYGDKDPNEEIVIEVKDTEGTVVSCNKYIVPFVYTSNATLSGTDENSIVFVKSDTLSIEGIASAKEIYVAPGAALQVNENGTLNVEKLVLRTTPFEAAILTNKGSIEGQVYYSRIARDTDFHLFAIPAGSNTAKVVLSDGTSAAVASTVAPYGNAWQLREYNTARRAELGATGANWDNIGVNADKTTYSDVAIEASKGYELRSGSKYYREYLFPVTLPTTAATSVQVTAATGAAGAADAGWNILCSPYTDVYKVEYDPRDPTKGITVSWQQPDGSYTQVKPTVIPPAIPFAYQASKGEEKLYFAGSTIAAAPRKQSAAEALTETEWVHLDIFDAYGEGDETSLFVHPTRFEQTYKTGIDVAKQSLTAARPIIYSTHAYGDMAFAGVADSLLENGIDIAVYSPAAQELTFSLRENKFLHRLEYLWLADNETGERTDLLMDDYTCRAVAGTAKGRFVLNGRFKAPQISTGIGNTQTDYNIYAIGNNIAISGVEQGTPIYVFDAVGHMIYTTSATSDEVIVPAPCAGVYMLTIGGQTAKLVINK